MNTPGIGTPSEPVFRTVLQVNDTEIIGTGDTVLQSLEALKDPIDVLSFGVLKVYKGKEFAELLLNVEKVKRLFADATYRLITASNLHDCLK